MPTRLLATVSVATLLCLSCSTVPPQASWGGQHISTRSQFNQSCGATCGAPVNASTGEFLAPAASRAGQMLEKAVQIPNNFTVEPRYRKDEFTRDVLLTDRREGSLRPDIVIHFTRNATRIQCIYDLKFPCGYEVGNPWSKEVVRQMKSYAGLGGQCKPALVTPQMGVDRQ